MKRVGLVAFLAAVLLVPVSAGSLAASGESETEAADSTQDAAPGGGSQVIVYYFHGDRRCKTCRTIEAYAEDVVRSRFGNELDSGRLAWKVVNYDEAENAHFIKEFSLVSASIVVVEVEGGEPVRFETLQKAWTLVRDKPGFDDYVHHTVLDFLS
jgi:hypothetical protein